MTTLDIIFGIVVLIMALFLLIAILLQSSKDHRLSGTIAGGAETFFGKQKGKSMDAVLNKVTAIVMAVFFVAVIAMYVVQPNPNAAVVTDDYSDLIDAENLDIVDETAEDIADDAAEVVEEAAEEAVDAAVDAVEAAAE